MKWYICLCFPQSDQIFHISLPATSEGQIVPTAFGLVWVRYWLRFLGSTWLRSWCGDQDHHSLGRAAPSSIWWSRSAMWCRRPGIAQWGRWRAADWTPGNRSPGMTCRSHVHQHSAQGVMTMVWVHGARLLWGPGQRQTRLECWSLHRWSDSDVSADSPCTHWDGRDPMHGEPDVHSRSQIFAANSYR